MKILEPCSDLMISFSFTCNAGYRLQGARMLECYADHDGDMYGTWSRPQPICRCE